jgi:phosphate transport system substrate-binding protein
MVTAITDQENADTIEKIRGGFGASTLTQAITEKRTLKVLRYNGVAPGIASINDGSYPYYKVFFLVTGSRQSRAAHAFIDFLKSPEGRAILARTGHLVLRTQK